jgi:hypothetical protein
MRRTSLLYKLARRSADVDAVERSLETGSMKPIERRALNRAKGRALARVGFWRRLWRS